MIARLLRSAVVAAAIAASGAFAAHAECPPGGQDFPPFYRDTALFEAAIATARSITPSPVRLTGLTVPHHLLADHLVAAGIRLVSGTGYDRVIVLLPDHFRQTRRPFATTARGFATVMGDVPTDTDAARALIDAAGELVEESCLFGKDHGIRALLPFLAHDLPGVPVLPVALSIDSSRAEWDRLVEALTPLAAGRTLILQSTDFSHYLPHHLARLRDQQTLNVLASGSLAALAALVQPDHLDSAGAMYVQAALQQRLHQAAPVVLASENGQQYDSSFVAETTSYMVLAFAPELPPDGLPPLPGARRYFLAGDTFFGRSLTRLLLDEDAAGAMERMVLSITGGAPLVVNLEGVLLPEVPTELDHLVLAMPAALGVEWLKRLNVAGVGLANNHAHDIGPSGLAETTRALDAAGIEWFGQGGRLDLPGIAIVGLADHGTNDAGEIDLIDDALLDRLVSPAAEVPVVAFVHWGREFVTAPSRRETELAEAMRRRGVAAIIGAHPHAASDGVRAIGGGDAALVHSLGNFLFDQGSDKASGALAELTVFDQGTLFVRQVPLPNLYEVLRGIGPAQQPAPKSGSR